MDYPITPYPALSHAYESMAPGRRIDMIVVHATAGSRQGDLYTLSGRDRRHLVSIHYYITKLGEIYQLVQDKDIAWHAGVSYWQGDSLCNQFSIGVELENLNNGIDKYPDNQINALRWLMQTKVRQYNIPRSRFVRHSDISPGRKTDPRSFPWESFKASVYDGLPAEPPPPPNPIIPPEIRLRDILIDWSYRRVNHVFHPDYAPHQFALANRLGPPMVPAFRFQAEGKTWQAEMYGTDAICSPTGEWQDIRRLSALDDGELKTVFRAEAYKQLGVQYHSGWAIHEYADRNDLGVPLSEHFSVSISTGQSFVVQIFQLDTLFSPVGKWNVVLPLSGLTNAAQLEAPESELRDLLLNQLYVRIGNRYHPEWELHKYVIRNDLGAPLSDEEQLDIDDQDYVAAAYARDVVFTPTGDWTRTGRLSELL